MNSIIFINSDLERCQFINSKYNITDNLDSLIEQSDNQSNLTFVLSKQCCFSDYLEVPKKNKSLFKKNAKKIIKQDLELSSDDLMIVNSEHKDRLPYTVLNRSLIIALSKILERHKLQSRPIYFETSLLKSDQNEWKFLIKENNEINIYFNGNIFSSNSENLSEDINVLFNQNEKPNLLSFYSFKEEHLSQDNLKSFQSQNDAQIKYESITNDQSLIDIKNAIYLKQLLKAANNNSSNWAQNWKTINLAIFSIIFSLSSLNYFQSSTQNSEQLEMRLNNLFEFISHDKNTYEKSDLLNIVYSIKNTKNLPNINHINTLSNLGEVFGIPGIELDQLNIKKDNTVYLKIHSTKNSSISRMNDSLQNNNYFLSKVRSIQNISDQKIQMEIDLTFKGIN
tara:strand:- start:623 stop:1807 length:1185 start_codon:yes stop_codon:yes gene_type:complete